MNPNKRYPHGKTMPPKIHDISQPRWIRTSDISTYRIRPNDAFPKSMTYSTKINPTDQWYFTTIMNPTETIYPRRNHWKLSKVSARRKLTVSRTKCAFLRVVVGDSSHNYVISSHVEEITRKRANFGTFSPKIRGPFLWTPIPHPPQKTRFSASGMGDFEWVRLTTGSRQAWTTPSNICEYRSLICLFYLLSCLNDKGRV